VTTDLKATIIEWFQFREVCDDDKFPIFFKRALDISLARYNQLLRIEPGVSQYDWLVQKYNELQRLKSESGTNSSTKAGSGEEAVTATQARSANVVRDFADTTYVDGLLNDTNGGQKTSQTAFGKTTSNSGSVVSSNTNTESGSIRDENSGTTDNDTKGLAKNAPQSVSYGVGSGMPNTLDWSFPGSQTEQKTHGSESGNSTRTFNNHRNVADGTVTDNRGSAEGGSDTTTVIDTTTRVEAEHSTTTANHSGTLLNTMSQNGTNAKTFENTERQSGSDSRSGDERVRESGRDVDIATLLTNAKQFIVYSSAFEWLRDQLEPCFMGIYD